MIELEADVSWWDGVAACPEVGPHVFMGREPFSLSALLDQHGAIGLRGENGGAIFIPRDPLGIVLEMHTLFRPEGWGREVALVGREIMGLVFKATSLLLTHEQEGYWRSRPPKSHGWVACADFQDVGLPVRLRLWALTREGWMNSVVGRKTCQQ